MMTMKRDELSEDDERLYDENLFLTSSGVRPCLVHRIDKDTTGLLVVAKKCGNTQKNYPNNL
jgi:23S rRNA-/tRNA-specific pseudouridylate synthase